jgi:hexosaminidase
MPVTRQVEYMAFPRACALSEVVWSRPEMRDFQDFSLRIASHYERLAARDVNVRIPSPTGFAGPQIFTRDTVFEILNPVPGAVLRYTTDGSEPTDASRAIEGPVAVGRSMALRAKTFLKSGKASPVATGYMSLVDTTANGVEYKVFDGRAASLKEIEKMTPFASGSAYGIGLEGLPLPKDTLTILFTGVLAVQHEGVYAFSLSANENAALFIDRSPVASDTTSEWWRLAGGRIFLRPGPHAVALVYTRNSRGAGLDLQIEGPALDRQRIPADMLRRR